MSFELPKLSYSYDALEPHIDAKLWKYTIVNTMQVIQPN